MSEHALDQFTWVRGPLPLSNARSVIDTSVQFGATSHGRKLQFGFPMVVRNVPHAKLGTRWEAFCSLLRRSGIPLVSSAKELESIGVAAVPVRIGRLCTDEGLDLFELTTADAFELSSRARDGKAWGWRAEIGAEKKLTSLIGAIRAAADGDTPIGVVLPLGADDDDVKLCLNAGVDFLTMESAESKSVDAMSVWGMARSRQLCIEGGRADLPLLFDVPVRNAHEVLVCLALGGTAVSADAICEPLIQSVSKNAALEMGGGMLSGIGGFSSVSANPLAGLELALSDVCRKVPELMERCGARCMSEIGLDKLRAVSQDVARLSGASLLC